VTALADLRGAVSFLTPLGGNLGRSLVRSPEARSPSPSPTTMAWFPAVGAAIGCGLGNIWRWSGKRLPPWPAAVVVTIADCALTGGLHLDGLADTADGLFAHAPRRSRLEIMAEPQIGTFAALALGAALLARTAGLSVLKPSPALLAALYCSSRSAMVLGSRALPYARSEGLASAFLPGAANGTARPSLAPAAAVLGAGSALVLAGMSWGSGGTLAVLAGWAGAAGVFALAGRRLGGFTGDVLGAAGVVFEIVALLTATRVRQAPFPVRGRPA
jgi:adenosylcobinamide-GDP ribazoletransferase